MLWVLKEMFNANLAPDAEWWWRGGGGGGDDDHAGSAVW